MDDETWITAGAVVLVEAIVILIIIILLCCRKRSRKKKKVPKWAQLIQSKPIPDSGFEYGDSALIEVPTSVEETGECVFDATTQGFETMDTQAANVRRFTSLPRREVSSLTNILKRHVAVDLQNSRRSYITSFHKGYNTFHGTRVYGKGTVLKAPDSDVRLCVPPDVEAFIYGHAHTGLQHFVSHIPEDECVVSPIADYHCIYKNENQNKNEHPFQIVVPHCAVGRNALASIRVRHGDIYKNKSFEELSRLFQVDESYITIYTSSFSQFICTCCQRICHGQGKGFVFGNLIKYPSLQPLSSVRLYLCSPLYNIKDFRKEIKEVEQQYNRSLVEEEDLQWKPEEVTSAQYLLISVEAQNEAFIPRQPIPEGLEWNQESKTLMQKKKIQDMHDMFFCHLCKAEPSIVATFHFEHRSDDASNLAVFSGALGMHTDTNDVILQTFFAVKSIDVLTKELSRQQEILAEITREVITTDDELMRFGLHLGFTHDILQQTRTNHPRSVEGAALHLACIWWSDGMTTGGEKVPMLLEAVRAMGKVRLVKWVEEKLKGGINRVDGTCDIGMGGIERLEGASVMVVDEAEERREAIVPVRERLFGSEFSTYL